MLQNLLWLRVVEAGAVDVRGRRGVSELLHGWLTLGADRRKLGKYGKCRGIYGHEAVGRDPKVLGDMERASGHEVRSQCVDAAGRRRAEVVVEKLGAAAHEVGVPDEELFVVDNGGRVLDPWELVEGDQSWSTTAASAMSCFRLGSTRTTVTA